MGPTSAGERFFLKPDPAIVSSLQAASRWANGQSYEPAAVTTFLQLADYYLVAHAHAHGHVVVTHEVVAHSTKKIKIPNACIGLGIKCLTPYQSFALRKRDSCLEANGSEDNTIEDRSMRHGIWFLPAIQEETPARRV